MLNNEEVNYELCGIIQHTGTAQGGHYFSDVKRDSGNWLCCNDTLITNENEADLPESAAGGRREYNNYSGCSSCTRRTYDRSCNAYLLFYKKKEDTNDQNQNQYDIDSQVMERLLPDIKETILKEICSTQEFSDLIILACQNNQGNEFLYNHFLNCLRSNANNDTIQRLYQKCIDGISNDQKFCDFILSRNNDLSEFLLNAQTDEIKNFYNTMIDNSIANSSDSAKDSFIKFYFNLFKNSPETLFQRYANLNELFNAINQISKSYENIDSWFTPILHFIGKSLNEYDKANSGINIYHNIDLSILIDLLTRTSKNPNNSKTLISTLFGSSPDLIRWIRNSKNHKSISKLLITLMNDNSNSDSLLFKYIRKQDNLIKNNTLMFFYNLSIQMSDNDFMDSFVTYSSKKKIDCTSFLDAITTSAKPEYANIIIPHIKKWISRFLTSSYPTERKSFMNYIYALFPTQQGNEESNESSQTDDSMLKLLFQTIQDSIMSIDDSLKIILNSPQIDHSNVPINSYFTLFKWVIEKGNYLNLFNANNFTSWMKKADNYSIDPNVVFDDSFNFIFNLFKADLFKVFPMSKISSWNQNSKSFKSSSLLITVLREEDYLEFAKSKYFKTFCTESLKNLSTAKICEEFILSKLNISQELSKALISIYWSYEVLSFICQNFRKEQQASLEFFKFSFRVLRSHPETSEFFYQNIFKTICYSLDLTYNDLAMFDMTKKIQIKEYSLYSYLCKLLSEFHLAYDKENQVVKKSFLRNVSKSAALVENYIIDIGLLLKVIRNSSKPNGVFYFLSSYVTLCPQKADQIYIRTHQEHKILFSKFSYNCKRGASKLVSSLAVNISKKDIGAFYFYKEFINFESCDFKTLYNLCEAFSRIDFERLDNYNSIIDEITRNFYKYVRGSNDLRVFHPIIREYIIRWLSPRISEFVILAKRLVSQLILNSVHNQNQESIQKIGTKLSIGIDFINATSNRISASEIVIIPDEESRVLLSIFQNNNLMDAHSKLLQYLEKERVI